MTAALTTNTRRQGSSQEDGSGPYLVTSANDNATYHHVELDGLRLVVPIVGKRVKIFKKRQDENPNLDDLDDEKSGAEPTNVSNDNKDEDETDLSP